MKRWLLAFLIGLVRARISFAAIIAVAYVLWDLNPPAPPIEIKESLKEELLKEQRVKKQELEELERHNNESQQKVRFFLERLRELEGK